MSDDINLIALHEAGHAVAHIRLGIQQGSATILKAEGNLGAVSAEGVDHVWNKEQALPMVQAFCAGYAALIAAGHDEAIAVQGCESDFELAETLIADWGLAGDIKEHCLSTVSLMSTPENKRAVQLVADHLLMHKTLAGDYLDVLVTVADGETTEQEFQSYVRMVAQAN